MFSRRLVFPFIFLVTKSFAFDPVTASIASEAIMDKVDEAADVGFSMTDLLSELGLESDAEKNLQSSLDKFSDYSSQARDLKWSSDDLKRSLSDDLNNGESLARRMKSLKNAVQASKRIATIMGFRPKAAEKAVHIQEIRLNSMILEELQSIRRAQYLAMLEDKDAKIKRDLYLEKIINQEDHDSKRRSP